MGSADHSFLAFVEWIDVFPFDPKGRDGPSGAFEVKHRVPRSVQPQMMSLQGEA